LWLIPFLYLPGMPGNPERLATPEIDPRTGRHRFRNQTGQPKPPKPPSQKDIERARQRQQEVSPTPSKSKDDEQPCITEGLKELKNCNSIKDKVVRRGMYPSDTPYGQYRYTGSPGQAPSYALGALINRIKNNRGSISGRIEITKSEKSRLDVGLCPDGGGSHHQVRDSANQYIASIICCKCCQKDPVTKKEKEFEYCAILPKRIVPDAGESAPQGVLPKNNSPEATASTTDIVESIS
jgi:hypothetical protein